VNHVVWRIIVKIGSGAWAAGIWKHPEKRSRVNIFDAQFRAYREKTPWGIVTKFCMSADIHLITCATFDNDRVRGFGHGNRPNFPFPHWLASSPLRNSRTIVRVCDRPTLIFVVCFILQRQLPQPLVCINKLILYINTSYDCRHVSGSFCWHLRLRILAHCCFVFGASLCFHAWLAYYIQSSENNNLICLSPKSMIFPLSK